MAEANIKGAVGTGMPKMMLWYSVRLFSLSPSLRTKRLQTPRSRNGGLFSTGIPTLNCERTSRRKPFSRFGQRRLSPCPCGYFGDPGRECRCSPRQVESYRNRISGPLLDRIDIHVETPAVKFQELSSDERAEPSAAIRERVVAAREIQSKRFAGSRSRSNAGMSHAQLKQHCKLDSAGTEMLRLAMAELQLSARAYDRILKVARTIADLSESAAIRPEHAAEAIQYRTLDRNLWR